MHPPQTYQTAFSALQRLLSQSKYKKSTSVRSCITALYTADEQNPLRFSGKIGMLQLDVDRPDQLYYLRFYDIESLEMLMEVELFYGIGDNWRAGGTGNLWVFDLFAEGVIGFQFRNAEEAAMMGNKIKMVAPKSQQFKQLMKDRIQKQIQKKKQSSFFGKLKKNFGEMFHKQQVHQQSVILKVQKNKSITLNFETGEFDCENIPPEWEDMIGKAGLKKEDLRDREVAKLIYEETVLHQARKMAQENPSEVNAQHMEMIKQEKKAEMEDDKTTINTTTQQQLTQRDQNLSSTGQLPPPPSLSNLPPPPPLSNLPPPPPLNLSPPPLNLSPPTLSAPPSLPTPAGGSSNRADLMAQIRNNKLKLKPVKTTEKGVELDISSMNKEERHDLAEQIRIKLQKRKLALNRRKASQEQQEDN